MKQIFYSNVEPIVAKDQYLFNEMWKMAKPAEQKIHELEGSSVPGKVLEITKLEEIIQTWIKMVQNARTLLYGCAVPPAALVFFDEVLGREYTDAIARGVRCKLITEITRENVNSFNSSLPKGIEIRHLPNMKGAFGINDSEFLSAASNIDPQSEKGYAAIYSSHAEFVEQHKTIFDSLWNIATPVHTRLKEIEEKEVQQRL